MPDRFFSGRESWVFRAHALDELCGHHPDLIGQALPLDEPISYLLYSPVREVNAGPFGIKGIGGSHALAVTRDRLIVSRDPHRAGFARTVSQVPFASIFTIELGEALTLGWLVVRFAAAGQAASETVFFQSSGIEHFREAVRAWRAAAMPATMSGRQSADWPVICAQSPPYIGNQLAPVVLEDEQPRAVLQVEETWWPSAGRRPSTCASAAGLCAVTDRGFLVVESQRPARPGDLVFAVNVVCFAPGSVRNLSAITNSSVLSDPTEVVFNLDVDSVRYEVKLPLGRAAEDAVSCFVNQSRSVVGVDSR